MSEAVGILIGYSAMIWLMFQYARYARRHPPPPRRKPFAPDREFRAVASRLGVTANGASLSGPTRDLGIDVKAEASAKPVRETEWEYDYRVAAFFPHSLGLRLSIVRHDDREWPRRSASASVSKLFDHRFSVELADPFLARPLLAGDPEERLHAAADQGFRIDVNDVRVGLYTDHQLGTDDLERFVRRAAELAQAISAAHARLPKSERLVVDWPSTAASMGATWDARNRNLTLETEHGRLRAQVSPSGAAVVIALELAHSLGCDLEIQTASSLSGFRRWLGQDIVVGEPEFDAEFVVRGADHSTVCTLLDPTARASILELCTNAERLHIERSRIEVVVADTGLTPARFVEIIERMGEIARMLRGRREGVYRDGER